MKKGKESVWHEMLGNLLESFLSSRSQWSEDKDMILNEISLVIQNIIGSKMQDFQEMHFGGTNYLYY